MFTRLTHAVRNAFPRARRRRPGFAPAVAALESRALLTTVPTFTNGAPLFVTELYNDLFLRNPTANELSYNVNALKNGETVEALTHKLVTSSERKAVETVSYYQMYLGRNPDLGGLTYQLDQLNHGVGPVAVQRGIIRSPEFQAAHVSNASFVNALYNDILGRAPDPAGAAYWVDRLNRNVSTRDQMAQSLFNTREYAARVINSDYQLVLNRNAEPGAVKYWTPNLQQTGKDGDLLVALFASTENFNNLKKLS